jgi:hypothetical protein
LSARVRVSATAFLAAALAFVSFESQALAQQGDVLLPPSLTYRLEATVDEQGRGLDRFDPWQIELLQKINRRDLKHLKRSESVIVPDGWWVDERAHSGLPAFYEWAEPHPQALVVHQPGQVFGAYERGILVRWGPVSTGKRSTPTPSGLFHLTWRSRGHRSSVNPAWFMPWYFNFEHRRGLAFHEHPLPGQPASHACIRLLRDDARWLYEWGEPWKLDDRGWEILEWGTPVLILGAYDFDAPSDPLWHEVSIALPEDPLAAEGEAGA